jgi:hypothetical protein
MGKGQIAILLIIIVIGLVAVFFLLPTLNIKIGPIIQPITYKNDIITVEGYSVSSKKLYPGLKTTISFLVQNNGDETAKNVIVDFTDLHGMTRDKLECDKKSTSGLTCNFGDVDSLDIREVSLTLVAPEVSEPTNYVVTYKVNYDYSGYREARIPVIDRVTFKKPPTTYKESSATYGPVLVEFEPPIGGTTIQDDQEIQEYWGVKDTPFQMKINFKHIGSNSVGQVTEPILIKIGNLKLTLPNLLIEKPCDTKFNPSGSDYIYNKELKVPTDSIICNFKSQSNEPWFTGVVGVSFSYNYEFYNTQGFNIQPLRT